MGSGGGSFQGSGGFRGSSGGCGQWICGGFASGDGGVAIDANDGEGEWGGEDGGVIGGIGSSVSVIGSGA